jgi:hypothetical protein
MKPSYQNIICTSSKIVGEPLDVYFDSIDITYAVPTLIKDIPEFVEKFDIEISRARSLDSPDERSFFHGLDEDPNSVSFSLLKDDSHPLIAFSWTGRGTKGEQ